MNKSAILGAVLLGGVGYLMTNCSGNSNNNPASGGASSAGGNTSTGGASQGDNDSGTNACSATPETNPDGGLVRIGATDPSKSVTLDVGGYYAMSSTYHGQCYTIADDYTPGGSTTYPPCGSSPDGGAPPPCFTVDTGLCVTQNLGIASGSNVWGAGIGCNISQNMGGTYIGRADISGKTSLTVGVYGCEIPTKLQVQVNMHYGTGPAPVDGGAPGTGYFCEVVNTPKPDANGISTVTVKLTDLIQNCWDSSGGNIPLNPQTMQIEAVTIQVNSDSTKQTHYDFCVSTLSIN